MHILLIHLENHFIGLVLTALEKLVISSDLTPYFFKCYLMVQI